MYLVSSAQMAGQTENATTVGLPGGVEALYAGGTLQRFRFPDWKATIRAESNPATRTFTESVAFAPFGERYSVRGAPYNVDSFTGKPDQLTSDEYDFEARELHSGQGRWVSPDPMPGTGNKYVYVDNNPLSNVDIYGLLMITINSNEVASLEETLDAEAFDMRESHPPASTQTDGHTGTSSGTNSSSSPQPPPAEQPPPAQQAQLQPQAPAQQAQNQAQKQSTQTQDTQPADNTLLAQNQPPPPPGRTPAQGLPPDTPVVIPDGKGGSTTRIPDSDGKAVKDIDRGHDHGAGDPHAHDWDWTKKPPRQPGRPLTPEEQQNLKRTAGGVSAGVIIYWIISEATRLFPPRNLIPVP